MKKIFLFIIVLVLIFLAPEKVFSQDFPVTVTVGSISKPISPFIWGVSYNGYHTFTSADQIITSFAEPARLKNIGIKMFRYPGGCPSDVYNWKTNEMEGRNFLPSGSPFLNIDELLKLTSYLQAEPLYTVNVNYKIVGNPCGDVPQYPGLTADQNKQKLIQDAVDLVHTYKGRIKYFELGNEQYLTGYTPDEYQAIALPIAQAMKNEDPTIQIGLISFFDFSTDHSKPVPWSNMVKNIVNSPCGNVACFDYVSSHDYFGVGYGPTIVPYAPLLKHGHGFDNATLDFAPKKIAMTEWNTGNCWEASAGKSSAFWGMFYEEMLLTMAEKGVFIANYHEFMDGSPCSLIRQNTTDPWRSAEQVFSLSSVLAGGKILQTDVVSPTQNISYNGVDTNVPYVTAHAGYSPDGTVLYVFLLNHHQTQSTNISLNLSAVSAFVQEKIRVDKLSASSLTDSAFTQSTETIDPHNPLNIIVPPISIIRLTISAKIPNCSITSGPSQVYLGQSGTFNVQHHSPGGSLNWALAVGREGDLVWQFSPSFYPSGNDANYSYSWTPTSIGTYDVFCKSWNDSVAECDGNNLYRSGQAPTCAGPKATMTVSVVQPGDLDGDGDVDSADFNKMVADFGHPYNIFDYNILVGNFGK